MKKNFKKMLAVLLATLMLCSIFSVCVTAAGPYTVTLAAGIRGFGGVTAKRVYGEFNDKIEALSASAVEKTVQEGQTIFKYGGVISNPKAEVLAVGDTYYEFTYTDANDVVYTFTYTVDEAGNKANQAVTFQTDAGGNFKWPEAFFKMPGYGEQSAWGTGTSMVSNTTAALTDATKKVSNNTSKFYAFYQPIISLAGGTRTQNSLRVYGEFNAKIEALSASAVAKTVQKNQYVFAYDTSGSTPKVGQLEEGATYYEFDYTANGVKYTFTYTLDSEGKKADQAVFFRTDEIGNYKYPEAFFTLAGYGEQNKWGSNITSNGSNNFNLSKKTNSDVIQGASYPTAQKYTVTYNPGSFPGVEGSAQVDTTTYTYGKEIVLKDILFTRTGFVQAGWSLEDNVENTEENKDKILSLSYDGYKIFGDVEFYPVWQEVRLEVKVDKDAVSFGATCKDYSAIEPQAITITNNSNSPVTLALPVSTMFEVTADGSLTIPADGGVLKVAINPVDGLAPSIYDADLLFDLGNEKINFKVNAKFSVREHVFARYVYNNDALYYDLGSGTEGTETASCHNGCGATDTRIAAGSTKVFSVDNNKADGILDEYITYKTVNFVVFGSGMDYYGEELEYALNNNIECKRFRPTAWSVNQVKSSSILDVNTTPEAFSGTFEQPVAGAGYNAEDYRVKYTHQAFGSYELKVSYVEETLQADGTWEATGVTDEKSYEYSIGPSEKDEQEVILPNTIVSLILGLFDELIKFLKGQITII